MAKKKSKKAPKSVRPPMKKLVRRSGNFAGDALASLRQLLVPWLSGVKRRASRDESTTQDSARVVYAALLPSEPTFPALGFQPAAWELANWNNPDTEIFRFSSPNGPVIFLRPRPILAKQNGYTREEGLEQSFYARGRDLMGAGANVFREGLFSKCHIEFYGVNEEEICGALVGLEVSRYRFKESLNPTRIKWPTVTVDDDKVSLDILKKAMALASGVNLARQLVNLPPEVLNPVSYASQMKSLFKKYPGRVQVEVWDEKRLAKEQMNLHLAVGRGSEHPPQLVILRYRPSGNGEKKAAKQAPVALVGKGITFDTGGLDIKPSSGMRWMKKDMGGSATLVGLCQWACLSGLDIPLDVYLPLAENAVGSRSFAPGDVIRSRKGVTVEIHNTDAEGRLVLADALELATHSKKSPAPRCVIDVATLTGAIKVALGTELGGLFSNQKSLAGELARAGQASGDAVWHMPLVQKYRGAMKSTFADMNNAVDGFGGAITAALFLQDFVGDVPWAHLDIYAWKDGPEGCYSEMGASGQAVQLLAHWLQSQVGR